MLDAKSLKHSTRFREDESLDSPAGDIRCDASASLGTYTEKITSWMSDASRSLVCELTTKFRCLDDLYSYRNRADVVNFLWTNPFLVDFLFQAHRQIRVYFHAGSEICLDLHRDPEEDYDELFVVIMSPYSSQKARELMSRLRKEWFLDALDRTQGKLCITEEPL